MKDLGRIADLISGECPAVRVRELSRVLSRIYDAALRPIDLQASQLPLLVAVAKLGDRGARIGQLAGRLAMDRTTLTRNIKPLEQAGLLRVSRAPDDARARVLTLTRAGEQKLRDAYPLWERAQKRVRELLGPGRMEAFRAHVSEVIELASAHEGAEVG